MFLLRGAIAVALCTLAIVPFGKTEEGPKYTVLAMEYFGALDHPIYPIAISNSYGGAEWYRDTEVKKDTPWTGWQGAYLHVVSRPLLERLIATVESNKGGLQQGPEPQRPYNGVSMTIATPQGSKTLFFHVEAAMTLLDQFENLCKDYKPLRSDLSEFKGWISLWGDNPPPRPSPPDPSCKHS